MLSKAALQQSGALQRMRDALAALQTQKKRPRSVYVGAAQWQAGAASGPGTLILDPPALGPALAAEDPDAALVCVLDDVFAPQIILFLSSLAAGALEPDRRRRRYGPGQYRRMWVPQRCELAWDVARFQAKHTGAVDAEQLERWIHGYHLLLLALSAALAALRQHFWAERDLEHAGRVGAWLGRRRVLFEQIRQALRACSGITAILTEQQARDTTLVWYAGGHARVFFTYQEWPRACVFSRRSCCAQVHARAGRVVLVGGGGGRRGVVGCRTLPGGALRGASSGRRAARGPPGALAGRVLRAAGTHGPVATPDEHGQRAGHAL